MTEESNLTHLTEDMEKLIKEITALRMIETLRGLKTPKEISLKIAIWQEDGWLDPSIDLENVDFEKLYEAIKERWGNG